MTINRVVYERTDDGIIIAYVQSEPKIRGKGNNRNEALADLLDAYQSIQKTINRIRKEYEDNA